MVNVEGATQC
jgi:hypothetical protein